MAGEAAAETKSVSDRFPALRPLEEDVERAKLDQALAEARSKAVTAVLPSTEVEVARDTVTATDKTTGLAQVLVQMCSAEQARDVASLALDAARDSTEPGANQKRRYKMRVVDDPEVFRDVDVARILDAQLSNLVARIDEYAPATPAPEPGEVRDAAFMAVAGPIIGLGLQAVGLASKLFAHEYRTSGAEIPVKDLGFDLLLAQRLIDESKDDEEVIVEVDRILGTPEAPIFSNVAELALSGERRLAPAIVAAAGERAEAQATFDAAAAEIAAIDPQVLEFIKLLPDNATSEVAKTLAAELEQLRTRRTALAHSLPQLRAALAVARERHATGTKLLEDIKEFLTRVLTPEADGTRAPIIRAARVEGLMSSNPAGGVTHFLYARLIAGGLDYTIDTKALGADRWLALTGTTVEFALVATGGDLCRSGVRSGFQSSAMKLGGDQLEQERPGHGWVEREKDD